jgi:hypothetical protein
MRLTLAPVIWMLHFLAVYVLATIACEVLAPASAIATAAALAAYAGIALIDRRRLRAAPGDTEVFVSRTNLLVVALSALGTLWVAYPAFALPPCA